MQVDRTPTLDFEKYHSLMSKLFYKNYILPLFFCLAQIKSLQPLLLRVKTQSTNFDHTPALFHFILLHPEPPISMSSPIPANITQPVLCSCIIAVNS